MTTPITIKRINGFSYQSSDNKFFISHEGSRCCWFACELEADGYPDEFSKQYFTSYGEAKQWVMDKSSKAGK